MQSIAGPVAVVVARKYFQIDARQVESECRDRARLRFYFVARKLGLDTRNGVAIRYALSVYLGRLIDSPVAMSGGQWQEAIAGLECGVLTW